jgi:hypothetical protein
MNLVLTQSLFCTFVRDEPFATEGEYWLNLLKYVLKKVHKTLRYEFSSSSGLFCPFVSDEPFAIECV